jgi:hypothetical protein
MLHRQLIPNGIHSLTSSTIEATCDGTGMHTWLERTPSDMYNIKFLAIVTRVAGLRPLVLIVVFEYHMNLERLLADHAGIRIQQVVPSLVSSIKANINAMRKRYQTNVRTAGHTLLLRWDENPSIHLRSTAN